jgi:methyl-accepting chemotaxis protein
MSISKEKFTAELLSFTTASVSWCAAESEKSILAISKILDSIVEDADRVSKISEETLSAVHNFKSLISSLEKKNRNLNLAHKLVGALNDMSKESVEVGSFIQPILEALQFQDRITQNMNNMKRMIEHWMVVRGKLENGENISLLDFGAELVKLTAMEEERAVICSNIPGLQLEENVAASEVLFF